MLENILGRDTLDPQALEKQRVPLNIVLVRLRVDQTVHYGELDELLLDHLACGPRLRQINQLAQFLVHDEHGTLGELGLCGGGLHRGGHRFQDRSLFFLILLDVPLFGGRLGDDCWLQVHSRQVLKVLHHHLHDVGIDGHFRILLATFVYLLLHRTHILHHL